MGTIERLDPRLDQIVPREPCRADRRRVRLVGGAGLGSSEGVPALLRRAHEHGLQVAAGQGRQRVPQAKRLHRRDPPRRRAGIQRLADGPLRAG